MGSAAGLSPTAAWTAESDQASADFGFSVGFAGDVNGDGFSDIVIGAFRYDNGQAEEGRAFLYLGSAGGLTLAPAWTAEPDQASARFGVSGASAGDVNGDGFGDVIIGCEAFDNGQMDEGRAFLYLGSLDGLASTPAWTAESNQADAFFGVSVGTAGDVNDDGFSDVIVGADNYTNGQSEEGRAFVYHGSAAGLEGSPSWTAESNQAGAGFGWSVGSAGDVNGDGCGDVIVGAPSFDVVATDAGEAFAYYGNNGGGLVLASAEFASAAQSGGINRIARQTRADDTAPIALLGKSDSGDSFRLKALGQSPAGRTRVQMEWEVKPRLAAFTGMPDGVGASVLTGAPASGGSTVALGELVSELACGGVFHWRLRIASRSPFFPHSPWLSPPGNASTEADVRICNTVVAVSPFRPSIQTIALEPNAPDPFFTATRFSYSLPAPGLVRFGVYDVAGRLVRVLVRGYEGAGAHASVWDGKGDDGSRLPPGIYFARLQVAQEVRVRRVVMLR